MLPLTNGQRACFGLSPVDPTWRLLKLPQSLYDDYYTYAYVDDATHTIRKVILDREDIVSPKVHHNYMFVEQDVCEELSKDGAYLLPKTAKGKQPPRGVKLSAATLTKRPCAPGCSFPAGMGDTSPSLNAKATAVELNTRQRLLLFRRIRISSRSHRDTAHQ